MKMHAHTCLFILSLMSPTLCTSLAVKLYVACLSTVELERIVLPISKVREIEIQKCSVAKQVGSTFEHTIPGKSRLTVSRWLCQWARTPKVFHSRTPFEHTGPGNSWLTVSSTYVLTWWIADLPTWATFTSGVFLHHVRSPPTERGIGLFKAIC